MIQDTITSHTFTTEEEYTQIMQQNENSVLIAYYDLSEGKSLVFSDNAKQKYISSLEDQILLLADELSGGIL